MLPAAALAVSAFAQGAGGGVAGRVFVDADGDGRLGVGERPLAGVVVSNQLEVVRSGPDGRYVLASPGYGVVFVTQPRGYRAASSFWREVTDGGSADFPLQADDDPEAFSFVHASDSHVSEESLPRLERLRALLAERRPAFVLFSGDLVKDALRVAEPEARRYYDLYTAAVAAFPAPVWSAPGNHEIFGIERHHSLVGREHPLFGKKMYRKRLGPNYYSFERGRVHFIALDTVDIDDLWYHGHVDEPQLRWLEQDLAMLAPGATVVTFNHIPLRSAGLSVAGYVDSGAAPSLIRVGAATRYRHVVSNAAEVLRRLSGFDHTLALGGHNHAFERLLLDPRPGATRFHQAAAVVGPGSGAAPSPSGVTLYRVEGAAIDDGEFLPLDR